MLPTYPDNFPLTQLTDIVSAVRSGNIAENTSKIALDIWIVQGYGQRSLLGLPESEASTPIETESETSAPIETEPGFKIFSSPEKDAALIAMEAAVASNQEDSVSTQADIPWDIIIPFLISLAGQLFSK